MQTQLELLVESNTKEGSTSQCIAITLACALISLALQAYINRFLPRPYFFLFFPAVIISAWTCGFYHSLATTLLCVIGADFFYYEPRHEFGFESFADSVPLVFVTLVSMFSAKVVDRLRRKSSIADHARQELDTTLKNIGDAVIVIDSLKRIVFINPVAEKLTGWSLTEARGMQMNEVFRIVNQITRQPAENPVDRILSGSENKALARHTVLVSRDGKEHQIEDSAAPIIIPPANKPGGVVLVFRDVSELSTIEARALESEARLKLALASAKMGTFYIDLRTNEVSTSSELAGILGLDDYADDVYKFIDKMVHPEDREHTEALFREAIEQKKPYETEYRVVKPSGEVRWVLSRANVLLDSAGNTMAFSGVTVDINDSKSAEERLRSSERRFNILFRSAPQATALARLPEGVIVDVNPTFEELFEFSRDEVIGKTSAELNIHVDQNLRDKIYQELLQTGQLRNMEIQVRTKSGKVLTIANSVKIVDLDGIPHTLTSLLDITRTRDAERFFIEQAQNELRESEQHFRELVNSLPQMTWMSDPSGFHYWYNDRWYAYSGATPEELLGSGWKSVQHPDFIDKVTHWWNQAREQGEPSQMEYPMRGADGQYRWFLTRITPIKDAAGRIVKWCGTNTDIQEQKLYEENLAKSKEAAERAREEAEHARLEAENANALKSAFLANMSHEIRTPLGAMMGFADLLRDPDITLEERANYAEILVRNGDNLSVIINDILDLSKVEAGHLTLEFTELSPAQIAQEVTSLLAVKAKEKNLSFYYQCDSDTPSKIVSDAVRFRQILLNIVGNAIKFTQHGSVKVRSYGCHTESGNDAVCIEVSDTGIGIPESQKDKIFEMFVQADGSTTRRFGGTGLGLALSKRLAIALGGDVQVTQTALGKGSTFLITIENQFKRTQSFASAKLAATQEQRPEMYATLKGLNILVVDDSQDNRRLIENYLKLQGARVGSAENGVLGYRKAVEGKFDVILMDIQMPEMDGYTATRKLRMSGYRKPIIALTAHAMTEVRQKCLNAGCSGHLSKPINPKELFAVLAQVTKRPPGEPMESSLQIS